MAGAGKRRRLSPGGTVEACADMSEPKDEINGSNNSSLSPTAHAVNDFDTIPPSPSTVQEVLNRAQKHCDSHRLPTAFEDCSSSLAERRWGKSLQWDDGHTGKVEEKGWPTYQS
jgi:hypothetical protein